MTNDVGGDVLIRLPLPDLRWPRPVEPGRRDPVEVAHCLAEGPAGVEQDDDRDRDAQKEQEE